MKTFDVATKIGETIAMVPVKADYFVLDHGHLCFRKAREGGGYPTSPLVLAPGVWLTVEELVSPAKEE